MGTVRPATLEEARKANYAPWVDHRRHMETVCWDHRYARDVTRGRPQRVLAMRARTPGRVPPCCDYWQIMRAMDLNNLYYRDFQGAAVRDFAVGNAGRWYGGYANNR